MFLSQRIAADPKYLVFGNINDRRSLVDIRVKIMHAEKFIVGTDQLSASNSLTEMTSLYDEHVGLQKRNLEQRVEIYNKFAKLPYPTIFLENNFCGILIETTKHNTITITNVTSGETLIQHLRYTDAKQIANLNKHASVGVSTFEAPLYDGSINPFCTVKLHLHSKMAEEMFNSVKDDIMLRTKLLLLQLGEVLLFLNVTNKKVNKYKLNKQEVVKIPKPLINKYEYHILDVYRDHAPYVDQNDIEKQMFYTTHEARERRAHFVRGHFKERATGLYWWNAFMRNARNAKKGFVDKDYLLIK